jgi:hypothetical protein
MEVLVFKTSVTTEQHIEELAPLLNSIIQPPNWNFDLEDCDRILRIETAHNIAPAVVSVINQQGFYCEELLD